MSVDRREKWFPHRPVTSQHKAKKHTYRVLPTRPPCAHTPPDEDASLNTHGCLSPPLHTVTPQQLSLSSPLCLRSLRCTAQDRPYVSHPSPTIIVHRIPMGQRAQWTVKSQWFSGLHPPHTYPHSTHTPASSTASLCSHTSHHGLLKVPPGHKNETSSHRVTHTHPRHLTYGSGKL